MNCSCVGEIKKMLVFLSSYTFCSAQKERVDLQFNVKPLDGYCCVAVLFKGVSCWTEEASKGEATALL